MGPKGANQQVQAITKKLDIKYPTAGITIPEQQAYIYLN